MNQLGTPDEPLLGRVLVEGLEGLSYASGDRGIYRTRTNVSHYTVSSSSRISNLQAGTLSTGVNFEIPFVDAGLTRLSTIHFTFVLMDGGLERATFWVAPATKERLEETNASRMWKVIPPGDVLEKMGAIGVRLSSIGDYGAGWEPTEERPRFIDDWRVLCRKWNIDPNAIFPELDEWALIEKVGELGFAIEYLVKKFR